MQSLAASTPPLPSIDEATLEWRQGDFAIGVDLGILHVADLQHPLTLEAQQTAQALDDTKDVSLEAVFSEAAGFVVLTQTCDIVRESDNRPFVVIAPLIVVDEAMLETVRRWKRPRYAFVPGAASHMMVADLDKVMTIEKTIMVGWPRQAGCSNDQEVREFSEQVARKYERFAFPEEFVEAFTPVINWIRDKHGKASDLGKQLDSLNQIRIRAAPDWNEDTVELEFWFIENDTASSTYDWNPFFDEFKKKFDSSGSYQIKRLSAVKMDDISMRTYFESDKFDFDQLSHR